MKFQVKNILAVIALATMFVACDPREHFPPETILTYQSYSFLSDSINGNVNALQVMFSIQDGDNNVGLTASDTLPPYNVLPYSSNFFIYPIDKKNDGNFDYFTVNGDTVYYFYRIEPFNTIGALKGSLTFVLDDVIGFSNIKNLSENKIIRFEAFVFDRNLVQSNIAQSEEISLQ